MPSLKVFIYVQHLSGVGHFHRMRQIGLALVGAGHSVAILDGGSAVSVPDGVAAVQVPRLGRRGGLLAALDEDRTLEAALSERRRQLVRFVTAHAPDVILVEHFPFSKWELREEIEELLARSTRCNPDVKVIASLRDIAPRTRYEAVDDYGAQVLALLHRHFDALLVHGDPALSLLEDCFPAAGQVRIPVHYTGVVAAPAATLSPQRRRDVVGDSPFIVASVGGGADAANLLQRVRDAWVELTGKGVLTDHRLLLFTGLDRVETLTAETADNSDPLAPLIMGFDPDFRGWLRAAALSVSCAGYNTCADLLAAGVPALLVPNPRMSDQAARAVQMEARGVAAVVPPPDEDTDPLAAMIETAVSRTPGSHTVDIDGAAASARLIEQLAQASRASS